MDIIAIGVCPVSFVRHQPTGPGENGFFNIRSVIMTDGEGEWDRDSGDEEQSEECDDAGFRV